MKIGRIPFCQILQFAKTTVHQIMIRQIPEMSNFTIPNLT